MAVDKRYKHEFVKDDKVDAVELVRDVEGKYSVIEISNGNVINQIHHGFDYEEASYNFNEIVFKYELKP